MRPCLILFPPFIIIALVMLAGILAWGGLDNRILLIPASFYDIAILLILGVSVTCGNNRQQRRYHALILWFIAAVFAASSLMQVIDYRPPGAAGRYDLYMDNVVMAFVCVGFILTLCVLVDKNKIKVDKRILTAGAGICLFTAINVLLVIDQIRALVPIYTTIYDVFLSLMLVFLALSTNQRLYEYLCNRVCPMFYGIRDSRGVLHKTKKTR